tara:strand:+ start:399 stop:1097 length:699 start_codon:yes stop_codon:yes gene_type:complete
MVGLPFEPAGNDKIETYLQALYRLAIGIAAMLAVLRLVLAGAKYILSDVVTKKEDAKKDIRTSIIGLLIVLSAVLILETINPALNNLRVLDLDQVRIEPRPEFRQDRNFLDTSEVIAVSGSVGGEELARRETDCLNAGGNWRELNNSYQCFYPEGTTAEESEILSEEAAARELEYQIEQAVVDQTELRDENTNRPIYCARGTESFRDCYQSCIDNEALISTRGNGRLCTYVD